MANIIKILRSATANARPTAKTAGEPYVNFADMQLGVWNAAPIDLIAVRFWSALTNYVVGDHVVSGGNLYRCAVAHINSVPPSADWTGVAAGGVDSFNARTGAVTLTNGDVIAVLPPSSTTPIMDGAAAIGVGTTWARADHVHPSDTSRLALAGGTMTGQIVTVAPVAPGDAANKNYVDTLVGNLQLFLGTWQVAANTPSITVGAVNAGDYYIAVTAVPSVPETAPAGIPGIGGTLVANGDLVLWNGTIWQTVIGSGLTKAEADTFYVGLGGGVMTGALMLNATPPVSDNSLRAATTAYVDNAVIDSGVY